VAGDRRRGRDKSADQHRRRGEKRSGRRRLACRIRRLAHFDLDLLCLRIHIIDPLLRIGWADPGARGDELVQVGPVCR
jgi:hypothetical protein